MTDISDMSNIYILQKKSDVDAFSSYFCAGNQRCKDNITAVIDYIGLPITIVCENYYVDKVFRDSYYQYFASKHMLINRNCKRLSFFKGYIQGNIFYEQTQEVDSILQQSLVGIMVLKPIDIGKIGRTLIDPSKINISKCFVRTTKFDVIILGNNLHINAFPFSSQDGETMTCAETTVWNILEYYGTRYGEYKTIMPSNIINTLSKISQERNLPSRGLDYKTVSALLKSFEFSPRIYALEAFSDFKEYKEIFHYYVESGIPLAIGVSGEWRGNQIGHSMVCIGHAEEKKDISQIDKQLINGIPYINTAQYYDKYVIMDDNQIPYTIENFDNFTLYEKTQVDVFAVPLYRRIYLEANDASDIIYTILENDSLGINKMISEMPEEINEDNPLTIRIYLTSSRKYKNVRTKFSQSINESYFYSNFVYPKFLWVGEVSTHKSIAEGKIYGEVVLDATASRMAKLDSLILIRYLSNIGYKFPSDELSILVSRLSCKSKGFKYPYPLYINNLLPGGV